VNGGAHGIRQAAFSADGDRLLTASRTVAVMLSGTSAYDVTVASAVEDAFDRLHLASEVVAELRATRGLNSDVRQAALDLAERRGDDPALLNTESWRIVRTPNHPDIEYRHALADAERAVALLPFSVSCRKTLALAQYRTAQYQHALDTLAASPGDGASRSLDRVITVLARFKLGQSPGANDELSALAALRNTDEDLNNLINEAKALARAK